MGVTIHFEGRLRSAESLKQLVRAAREAAENLGWPSRTISEKRVHLARVRDAQDWDFVRPTTGIDLLPHEDSEPLRLEFACDLYVQELIKTEFADPDAYVRVVVTLLRRFAPFFETLFGKWPWRAR